MNVLQEYLTRGLVSMVLSPHFRVNPALSINGETALGIRDEVFGRIGREGCWR